MIGVKYIKLKLCLIGYMLSILTKIKKTGFNLILKLWWYFEQSFSQLIFTCSKSAIERLDKGKKYVQR